MIGRGRTVPLPSTGTTLRRPGSLSSPDLPDEILNIKDSMVDNLMESVSSISSPDDLLVQTVSKEILNSITDSQTLTQLTSRLCDYGLQNETSASVVGAICGPLSHQEVGDVKFKLLLLKRLQSEYANKDEFSKNDRKKFLISAKFLGEIFHFVKSETGASFAVLAGPLTEYLEMILMPHLDTETIAANINEEMDLIAYQLLQNGNEIYNLQFERLSTIVQNVTEIICRHNLAPSTKLNLMAALAELWPLLKSNTSPRTIHAVLAAKLGCSLQV